MILHDIEKKGQVARRSRLARKTKNEASKVCLKMDFVCTLMDVWDKESLSVSVHYDK